MIPAKLPDNEDRRIGKLNELEILDTLEEQAYDDLTYLAARICNTPIALVSFIDRERQWFKSHYGLDARETPREFAFCAHAILGEDIFVVEDSGNDKRFYDNPLVTGKPYVRFYAGVPLAMGDDKLGTLCVIGNEPRTIDHRQQNALKALARQVVSQLELRAKIKALEILDRANRESERRFRILARHAPVGIFMTDAQGDCRFVNERWCEYAGLSPEQAKERGWLQALHPDDKTRVVREWYDAARINREFQLEYRFLTPEGKATWLYGTAVALRDPEQERGIGYLGTVMDISERKQAEEALRASEQRFQLAVKGSNDGIWDWDVASDTVYYSPRFKELLGYGEDELDNNFATVAALLHPEDREPTLATMRACLESGKPFDKEFRLHTRNGGYRWFRARGRGLREGGGQSLRMAGSMTDITPQRRMTEKLRESESRLRTILDNVVDGIITIDERGLIESVNRSTERIFGYPAGELIGRNIHILMPEPYRSRHDQYIADYLRTGQARIIGKGREVEGLRSDGTTFPMDLAINEVILEQGRLFTGVVRDITERRRMERMKSEFISTVSHELRTPLTSIRGSLGLVAGGAAGELPPKAKGLIQIAHKNSERLVTLVNDILDIEKIESGKMDFHFRPIDLGYLISQAIEANRGYGAQFNVTLQFVNPPVESVLIQADFDRMMQVMANLLSNAVKFSPAGGAVEVTLERQDDEYRVSVIDHGSGIPEAFRARIFEKFAQADSSDVRQKGGTGLGLSITRAIVERHHGRIGYTTLTNQGTTFYFQLPAYRKPEAEQAEAEMEKSPRRRILVCEHDHDIAALLGMIMTHEGFTVDLAYTAAEAKAKLADGNYDAMTVDMMLPDQEGTVLIREIRQCTRHRILPIVVISAQAAEGQRKLAGQALGVVDWLGKPIDGERLKRILKLIEQYQQSGHARILHVEDDADVVQVISAVLGDVASIDTAATVAEAREMLSRHIYDLIILDMELSDGSGFALLETLGVRRAAPPVLVFSAREFDFERYNVDAALVKSRTTNQQLRDAIKSLLDDT